MKHTFNTLLLVALLSSMGSVYADVTSNSTSASDSTSAASANSLATGGTSTNSNTAGSATGTNTNVINFPSSPASNTVEYKGTYTVKTAPALYAPPLTTTMTDTCMGSSSLGASFSGFGINGGSTWTDKNCVRRLDSREFRAMGMNDVAVALLCQNLDNRAAVEATGRSCPSANPNPVTATLSEAPTATP